VHRSVGALVSVVTLRSLKRRVALLMDAVEDDYQVGILRDSLRRPARRNTPSESRANCTLTLDY
jgi:hypothetical protein